MKSRLFVVDSSSIASTISTNIASIRIPVLTGEQWIKTIADIMADFLQIEIGDYIFLWETKNGTQKNRIHGVYRAISKPYYQCSSRNDLAPFKIHIEKAYDFSQPVEEYEVLNNPYIKNTLWTIMGKKVAGKARGTTPLSIDESKYLLTLLIGKNQTYTFNEFDPARIIPVPNPLQISYALKGPTPNKTRATLDPNKVSYFNNDYSVKYEKVLETIFNQELTNRNVSFFSTLGIDVNKVIWYSNDLPYSVEQSEMDYVVMESEDKESVSKITLVEFIKTKLDESHIQRACLYSKWINETQGLGCQISRPMIICPKSYDFINGERTASAKTHMKKMEQIISAAEKEYATNHLEVYVYNISSSGMSFTQKR